MAINLSFTFEPAADGLNIITQETLNQWANNQDVIDIYTVEYVCGHVVVKPSYKFIDLSSHKNIDVLLLESFKEFMKTQKVVFYDPELNQHKPVVYDEIYVTGKDKNCHVRIIVTKDPTYDAHPFEWHMRFGNKIYHDPTSATNMEASIKWAKEAIDYMLTM